MDLSTIDLYSTTPAPEALPGMRVVSHAGTQHLQCPTAPIDPERSLADWQAQGRALGHGYGSGPTRRLDEAVGVLDAASVATILTGQARLPPALARQASANLLGPTLLRATQVNPLTSGPVGFHPLVNQAVVVGLLLAVGTRSTLAMLHQAASVANPEVLHRLLAKAPAGGWAFTAEDAHERGTPLHSAALQNHWSSAADTVDLLLAAGVPIDQADEDGMTPLAQSAKTATWWVMRRLLKRGANPELADVSGTTALHWAARNDDVPALRLLLAAGASTGPRLTNGNTPLNEAGRRGAVTVLQTLLDLGLDPLADRDSSYPEGRTIALARGVAATSPSPTLQQGAQACVALLERWQLQRFAATLEVVPSIESTRRRL